jgi:mono/diheme cytochrome c family protein
MKPPTIPARASAVLALASSLTLAVAQDAHGGDGAKAWTPDVPRVWDDEELASLELPLPSREHSPRHVPSAYYYAIPPRTIYRDYPVYHPDLEPPGYWEELHHVEPEVAFDPAALSTREDWIRAGELVFRQGAEYTTGSELAFVRDARGYAAAGVRLSADGRFPYARYVVREKGKVELELNSCASCHTRVLEDGSILLGGAGDIPLGRIIAYELRNEAAGGSEPEVVGRTSSDYRFAAAPWLDPDPGAFALGMSGEELARVHDSLPPGVFVRQRASYSHPVRIPDLIGVGERRFLDATGLFQQRSLADLMRYAALNEGLDELASYAGFRPAAEDFATLPDPATLTRSSDEQLYALALFLASLAPPPNPNPVDAAARRGAAIFDAQGCGRCHAPPHYTNDRLLPVPGFDAPAEHAERFAPMLRRIDTDPGLTLRTRRGTGYYKVPSLRGVWCRGPFFHDGSLASLEDVLDPRRIEADYVPTGFRGPHGERRSVSGHEHGLDLDEDERADLVAFLRTL